MQALSTKLFNIPISKASRSSRVNPNIRRETALFLIIRSQNSKRKIKMVAIEFLPKEYGYVAIVLVLYCFLNFWMGIQVGMARKKYKVPYPTLYASESENKEAKLFNCIQRGHQNSLEMMPVFFTMMILGGLRHPCVCAGLGVVFIITRYFYFKGYSTGVPENRLNIGKYGFLAIFGLMGCTISLGISLLMRA